MGVHAILTIAIAISAFVAMGFGVRAHRALSFAVAGLVLSGSLSVDRALSGFSNQGVATIALLFVIAAGVKRSGALHAILGWTLGKHHNLRLTMSRMVVPVAGVSAFLNNTPTVAMLLPEIKHWAEAHKVEPTKLLIPLSYAAILGGMCTLIGTSTNLLIDGMLVDHGFAHLDVFWIAPLGLPAAFVAIGLLVFLGPWLLPKTRPTSATIANPVHFTAEYIVTGDTLAGQRLDEVNAPGLKAFAPIQIRRDDEIIAAPRNDTPLKLGDKLMFAAPSAELLAMGNVLGLTNPYDADRPITQTGPGGNIVEAIVGPRCRLRGHSVGDGSFRKEYGAAVIAVVRDGRQKTADDLGAWIIELGDVLLLETDDSFADRLRYSDELFLVTRHTPSNAAFDGKGAVTLLGLVAMTACAALGLIDLFIAALALACALIATRILPWRDASQEINGRVLLTIVAALGLGAALEDNGVASAIANQLVALGSSSPLLTLALIYIATMLFTEIVTNNAAAVIMLPIALSSANALGVSPLPFIAALMIAASASFITPIGYQTNLLVYAAGGYRFSDFLRMGIPIAIVVGVTTITLSPLIWPF